jgi:hypothetical protein
MRINNYAAMSETGRDLPLSLRWVLSGESQQRLQPYLPHARRRDKIETMNSISAQALLERLSENRNIAYSRRKDWYSCRDYLPGHDMIVGAVDALAGQGLIRTWIAPSGWPTGLQSRLWPTQRLLDIVGVANDASGLHFRKRRGVWRPIELRDATGTPIAYPDTERTRRMGRNVERINEVLTGCRINIGESDANGRLLRIGQQYVNTAANETKRIFNEDINHGGRFYGPWWQQLPKKVREQLRIQGEPVVEIDHKYLHPRLLYASRGISLSSDPYLIDSWDRKAVKLGFNILVNARTHSAAHLAIAARLENTPEGRWPSAAARRKAYELILAIRAGHKELADAGRFHSGAGRHLMRVDSDMCEQVQIVLANQGITALPVHDSHIVQKRHADSLSAAMADAYELAANSFKKAS